MQASQSIEVVGLRLEVQHIPASHRAPADVPARPTLVFLHEGLGSVSMWRGWPARVCAAVDCTGLVYSRQGYGQSSPRPDVRGPTRLQGGIPAGRLPPDYMQREAWEVLPALLNRLDIARPVLIGHSDGGSVALLHASRFEVAASAVLAPHVIVEDISVQSIAEVRTTFEQGDLRAGLQRHHADPDGAFWQWNDVWLSPGFRSFDIRDDCRRITAPLLCIQGEGDPYGTMRQIDEIEPAGRKQMLKLPRCGHAPHRDQEATVTQTLVEFLRALD